MLNRKTGLLLALIVVLIVGYGALRVIPSWLTPDSIRNVPTVIIPDDGTPPPIGPGGAYLRGAHWFGEAWAVNFWNTRLTDRAAEDFAAIKADGFNTVVLVVPWPGFVGSPKDGKLVPERARRLGNLIDLADEAGLNVVLRIGYAWDSSIPRSGRWLMRLWFEEPVRQAWLRHIAALWKVAAPRPNVRFGFISWEDLWAVTGLAEGNIAQRLRNARRSGYRAWLQKYSDLDTVRARYGVNFGNWNEVPIPARMEPAYGLFLDFIDHAWIERFFKPAQEMFPTLSMEIRIDSDPVWNAPGDLAYWHSHELAWDLPGAAWTTVYWSPAMGSSNEGNTLSPQRAVELLEYQLSRLRAVTGNRPIFIDQFLVEDFTPGFEMNDRLDRKSIDEFLQQAAPVLRSMTHGYAVWTWRDYQHNAVPSPDFSYTRGNWEQERNDGQDGPYYHLAKDQSLQRSFGLNEFHAPGGPQSAQLCLRAQADGDTAPDLLVLSENLRQRTVLDVSGDGEDCVEIPVTPQTTVEIKALADLDLTYASFSGFTQPIGVRNEDGTVKPVADDWRALNRFLTRAQPAPFQSLGDGWMGKTLSTDIRVPPESPTAGLRLQFRTGLPNTWPFEPDLRVEAQGQLLGTVTCADDVTQELIIPAGTLIPGNTELQLTASRTYRPAGEERRLGCLIGSVELAPAD